MGTTTYQLMLKCGSKTLTLTDWTTFYPLTEGLEDNGQTVVVHLYVKEPNEAAQSIATFLHELAWFNARAVEYEVAHVKEPVYIGLKVWDGNAYDTVFGRGWLWKMLTGRSEAADPAIAVELDKDWSGSLAKAMIKEMIVSVNCKSVKSSEDVMICPWSTLTDRWVGQAAGAIRHTQDGAVIVEEGITNLVPNSDFENEADTDNGWLVSNVSLTAVEQASNNDNLVWNGFYSYLLTETGGASVRQFYRSITLASTDDYTLSCYARKVDGSTLLATDCQLYYGASQTTTFIAQTDRPGWYRLIATFAGVVAPANCGIEIKASKQVIVDSFQLEIGPYVTSLCYGNLGRGYSFSGTAHLSSSVREAAVLSYRNTPGTCPQMLPRTGGTVLIVTQASMAYDEFVSNGILLYHATLTGELSIYYDLASTSFRIYDGVNTATTGSVTFVKDDLLFIFGKWADNGTISISVYKSNGVLLGSGSATYAQQEMGDTVYLGGLGGGYWNGVIYEVQTWDRHFSTTEMVERVKQGVGSSELPYLWSAIGDGTIYNHDDSGHDNWVELANGPGDYDAGIKLLIENDTVGTTPQMLYIGQMRRGVPVSDLPSKRYLVGNHFRPWLEAEAGVASYDGETVTVADATASEGNKARTTPTGTVEVKRINIPICAEPEDVWKYAGVFRVVPRMYAATALNYLVRFRVVTGYHTGPYSVQFYADADSVWRPGNPSKTILAMPGHYQEPNDLQAIRPGDWAGATYCYLEYYVQAAVAAGTLDIDGVWLVPQDSEGFGQMPTVSDWVYQQYVLIDSASREPKACTVYDKDMERFRSSLDWSGRFYMTIREPSILTIMWRRSGTGYVWTLDDSIRVSCKYRPRYQKVR